MTPKEFLKSKSSAYSESKGIRTDVVLELMKSYHEEKIRFDREERPLIELKRSFGLMAVYDDTHFKGEGFDMDDYRDLRRYFSPEQISNISLKRDLDESPLWYREVIDEDDTVEEDEIHVEYSTVNAYSIVGAIIVFVYDLNYKFKKIKYQLILGEEIVDSKPFSLELGYEMYCYQSIIEKHLIQ